MIGSTPSKLGSLLATARAVSGTARDLASGLTRESFRDTLAAELGIAPRAVGTVLPWVVRTRPGADASLVKEVLARAEERPSALAIQMGDERLSWAELAERTSRVAHVLHGAGVRQGDVVVLFGDNSPSYLAIVLGASRLGATTALVNSKLEGQPLAHAVTASKARVVIAEAALVDHLRARPDVTSKLTRLFTYGEGDLDEAIRRAPGYPFPRTRVPSDSDFVYIYTSGTTGLPKPCRVTHAKTVLTGALVGNLVWEFGPGDKLYAVMPLYHSSALLLGFASCVMTGTPIALRSSFSARAFWTDVAEYRATAMLYIGELCRYLLNTPEHPKERDNSLRIAVGNGLRADLWEPFQKRFGVPMIREFYGATEAPGAIFNFTGRVGSVGRWPMRRLAPIKLVKYDVDRDEHVRGPDGLCIECEPGEVGELVIVLKDNPIAAISEFRGYTDEEATRRKIVRDVIVKGDRAFRSGDLMRFDYDDFFYFVDRIGDTFRFKGENVSTTEVAEVVGRAPGVKQVAVAGVAIPDTEERAGLAAIVCDGAFDPAAFGRAVAELPEYAQPRIVRVVPSLDTTATFKIQKSRLDASTIDPDAGDAWVRLPEGYAPVTRSVWDRLSRGDLRL
jgi:fatty-acyl-CoA synthase